MTSQKLVDLMVVKRDGRRVLFDPSKVSQAIFKAARAVGGRDKKLATTLADAVSQQVRQRFVSAIPTVEDVQDIVEKVLIEEGHAKTAKAYILYRRERAEIRKEKAAVLEKSETDEIDKNFDVNALRVLKARYLRRNEDGRLIETPKQLFTRVAVHAGLPNLFYDERVFDKAGAQEPHNVELFTKEDCAAHEDKLFIGTYALNRYHLEAVKRMYDRADRNGRMKVSWTRFFEMLKNGEFKNLQQPIDDFFGSLTNKQFMANTPAIANFGNPLGMGSACFVMDVEDSIDDIMEKLKQTSIVFKAGGGMGYNFSRLRPEGDFVKTTGGVASGPLSFMELFDKMTDVIKQGGIRRGANMGILNSNHPDIEKFITVKAGNKTMRNFNISVLIMPDFWEYYNKNKPYPLVNPRTGKVMKTVDPRTLFDKIVYQAWESAEPGVIFFDKVNEYNPFYETLGPIVTTNPCVAADTLVSSGNGLEQISHLTADQIIVDVRTTNKNLLQLGTSRMQPQQVVKTGIKPCYKLTTSGGYELTATEDHRLLTDDGWKELGQLLPGEKVLIQSGAGSFSTNKALPFLAKNDVTGENGRTYHFGFPVEWSAELGTVLGWLVGDGWLNQTYHQAGFVFAPEDTEVKTLLQPVLERYCGHALSEVNVAQAASQLRSSSAQVVDFFSHLGVKPVGEDREVPASLFTAPLDAVRGFLSGLFSADGTFASQKESRHYARLNSSSLKLLKGVQLLLLNMGIRSRITNRSTKPKRFDYVDAQGKERVYETSGTNYELNIARENLGRFLEQVPFLHSKYSSAIRVMRAGQSRGFYKERFVETVAAIDYVGEREVWDITEPTTHSFIANGFVVHNCGEVLLYGYESCNLGSVNVWSFAREDEDGNVTVDWEGMARTVRLGVRFLDNVIDVNKWPLPQIEYMALATRKVGLGIMGVGDLMYELGLAYNSPEGLAFMEHLMEFVNYHSKLACIELAKERGPMLYNDKSFYTKGKLPFAGFYDRKSWHFDWDAVATDLKKYGSRNAFTIVIAPTGSISMICGTSSGIEPVYSLVFEKNVKVGSFFYVDPVFERTMKREGLYDEKLMQDVNLNGGRIQTIPYIPPKVKKVFVTAMDISPEDHIRALAAFQKWVDSSISKTNNFPANATLDDMRKSFILAYKLGCKDVTVFRDSSIKDQVLVAPKKEQATVEQYAEKSELAETVAVRTVEPAEQVRAVFEPVDLNPAAAGMQTTLAPTLNLPPEAFGPLPKLPIDYNPDLAKQFKLGTPTAEPVTGIALPSIMVPIPGNGLANGNGHSLNSTPHNGNGLKKNKFDVKCPNCNIAPQVKEGCVTCPQCGWGLCS